ncbi:Nuclear transcription factor Y subunit [Arachis hypogaea]|nr:nuclear transcription factor Y subunit B-5 [Arachis hypogaea]QHO38023.1 Nuclear transcription factor Y subunit [Arachis hypogaea]
MHLILYIMGFDLTSILILLYTQKTFIKREECLIELFFERKMVDNIGGSGSSNNEGIIKEQDRLLPIANVGRIMKQILPQNAKISKEAKETMQECVSEYISFVTSEASEKCRKERRKTVNGDDICWALATLGFDDYAEGMRRYLQRYRELEVDNNNQERGK